MSSLMSAIIAKGIKQPTAEGILGGVAGVKNIEGRNKLLDLNSQITERNIQEFDANAVGRADERLMKSLQVGSELAMPFVQKNDDVGLLNYLKARKATLQASKIDTTHTDEAIAAMESGDPAQIAETKKLLVQFATMGQKPAKPTVLAKGAVAVDAAGNQIASNVQPEAKKIIKGADGFNYYEDGTRVLPEVTAAETTGDVRDRKIADLMAQGLDRAQAVNLVDGHVKQEISEKTGKVISLDQVSGTASEVELSGGETEVPKSPEGQSLWDLREVATGPVSTMTSKAAAALSFFGIDTEEASTGAIQTFNNHTTALIRALSINPRFPVAEMNRIAEEINIKPSFFQGADILGKKMRSLDASLKLRLDQAERDFNDPNLDVQTRQAQGANASALRNFINIMNVPEEGAEDPITSEILQLKRELEID